MSDNPFDEAFAGFAEPERKVAPKPSAKAAPVKPRHDGLLITKPGMYFDMACEDYFAEPCPAPALSNSGVSILLNKSPAHFARRHPAIGQPEQERKATTAMRRGSVVHRLALGAGKDFAVIDAADFRTKAAQEERDAAVESGLVPIIRPAFEKAEIQAAAVREHLDELLMGEPFLPEVVIAWQAETPHGLIWCRGMIDAWCPTLLKAVDLKSTTDASISAITKKMANDGYDTQDVWYSKGIGHILDKFGQISFDTLFCEVEPPFASQPVATNDAWKTSSWDLCEEAIEIFARCLSRNEWPGYPRATQTLHPPDWLINQRLNRRYSLGETV